MDDILLDAYSSDSEMLDSAGELPYLSAFSSEPEPDLSIGLINSAKKDSSASHSANYMPETDLTGLQMKSIDHLDDEEPGASPGVVQSGAQIVGQAAMPKVENASKSSVLARIEAIFEAMADVLLNERGQLSLDIMTRPKNQKRQFSPEDSITATPAVQHVCFPGKSEREAWRFSVVVRILELIHEALRDDVVLSKRDIYYRDPALFGQQSHVDRYVDNIAFTFGVPRSSLHVIAAAKGLISGAVEFIRRDGTTIDASCDREGLLVPNLKDILSAKMTAVKWILVIEKEATFRSISASDFWTKLSTCGIMVTAKGYPDISTRAMLHFLSIASPQNGFSALPVYALVDFDPDGIAIFSTYKYGSQNLAHETAALSLPQIHWLGLRSEHVAGSKVSGIDQGLLTLSARDRKKARSMLEWEALSEDDMLRSELQTMLMLSVKAELQLLDAAPNGMGDLIHSTLPL